VQEQEDALAPADPSTEAAVDVTLHVPGPLLSPDYEGMRTGRWVKDKRLLVVQVAVPECLFGSSEAEINTFFAKSLREAVELAAGYLAKKNFDLSLEQARVIADRSAAALVV
jgi:hypothetical protein